MTAWLIAHEAPERFRAAVAARGVYDLAGWYGSSNTWRLFEGEFGTRPWEDPEITRAQSPLTYVANIRTPLLLLHADTDFRTTIASAEALYRALKVLDREVEFVRYPREGHELTAIRRARPPRGPHAAHAGVLRAAGCAVAFAIANESTRAARPAAEPPAHVRPGAARRGGGPVPGARCASGIIVRTATSSRSGAIRTAWTTRSA
jgi:hypothetical protein